MTHFEIEIGKENILMMYFVFITRDVSEARLAALVHSCFETSYSKKELNNQIVNN